MENKKPDCVIKQIYGEEFIQFFPLMKELNFTDMTPVQCLSKCLWGDFLGYVAILDGKTVGMVVYRFVDPSFVFVIALHCKNNLKYFLDTFYDDLKKKGVKVVRSSTTRPEKAYGRVMKMKRLWTVYERSL
jgi:hypothetical protein